MLGRVVRVQLARKGRWERSLKTCSRGISTFPNDLGQTYIAKKGWSHVIGPSNPPLLELTVDEMLLQTVESFPSAKALTVSDGREVIVSHTYETLNSKVNQLARGFLELGIQKGDRVGVWMPNNEEWALAQFALARIGAILVCINPAYRKRELVHALNMVQAKALIMTPSVSSSNYIDIMVDLVPELLDRQGGQEFHPLQSSLLPSLKHVILASSSTAQDELRTNHFIPFESILSTSSEQVFEPSLLPDDPINIQFTSGTTGAPKGATLSSKSIVNNGRYVGDCMKLTSSDILNVCVPLYHCFGLVLGNLAAFSHGSSVVYPSRVFNPKKALEAVDEFKCTASYGVPTMFAAKLNDPDFSRYNLDSLRTGIMAGSNCPMELMRRAVKNMNLRELTIAYGQTETSPASFMSRTSDDEVTRCETVGRIMPNTECKLVDESGKIVPIGKPGELHVRGYLTMIGYYRDTEKTRETFEDDWLKTGDIGTLDHQGYLRIVGRSKDIIIRGGENLFPREIEEIIQEIPNVLNVQVVGVPDDKYGEEACAVIVPVNSSKKSLDEKSVKEYVKSQVSHQKVPKYVLFKDTMEDVMTVTGKLQKFKLRDWACKELGMN